MNTERSKDKTRTRAPLPEDYEDNSRFAPDDQQEELLKTVPERVLNSTQTQKTTYLRCPECGGWVNIDHPSKWSLREVLRVYGPSNYNKCFRHRRGDHVEFDQNDLTPPPTLAQRLCPFRTRRKQRLDLTQEPNL